ncbi:alpha/beta hydrolase [Streptomyces jumonjinensis]|nr:alpha/beta hydrolase [Streptomyces jumonjinensis]
MQVRRRTAPLLALSVMASLAPALAAAPAAAAPDRSAPQKTAKTAWQRCGPDTPASFRCATVKVPLDYRSPGGRKIDVEISRIKAADPDKRRGVLFINPGGPGGPGLDMPVELNGLPRSVKDRYDLIGFDPRGVGRSTPLACGLSPEERDVERPYKAETFARDTALSRGFADKCRAKYGSALQHFTTRNTARDMDRIRAALGEKKISYLGYSYGTYLGAVYTELFPQRSDRIVLDSAVDPKRVWRTDFRLWGSESQKAYQRWTKWTAKRSDVYRLGDTPAKVDRTFWRIVKQADREPVVVGTTPYTGDQIRALTRRPFHTVKSAAELVVTLKKAAAGKPTEDLETGGMDDNAASSLWAVTCGDADWPKNPETYRKDAVRDKARYPLYGDFASHINPCAFWDKAVEPPTTVDNGVRALILQNEWDSQTSLPGARGLRDDMKSSRMVLVEEGEGHGIYTTGSSLCVDSLTTGYLTTGAYPAKDVTCEPTPGGQRSDGPDPLPLTRPSTTA